MNRFAFLLFTAIVTITFTGCSATSITTDTSGDWIQAAELGGSGRTNAVCFIIPDASGNSVAYVGSGYNGQTDTLGNTRLNDFWSFSITKGWVSVDPLPIYVSNAVAFVVNGKGYITTGSSDGGTTFSKATYQFDPTAAAGSQWKKVADFLGANRIDAVGFGIGNYGYVGTGWDAGSNVYNDFYRYDPVADSWSNTDANGNTFNCPGKKRSGAVVFLYNNKAYLVTGTGNGSNCDDFYMFDPSASTQTSLWTKRNYITNVSPSSFDDDYTDIARSGSVAFVAEAVGGGGASTLRGYLTLGAAGTAKTWEYNFEADTWARKAPYHRPARTGAVAFAMQTPSVTTFAGTVIAAGLRGYITTGSQPASSLYLSDMDYFDPEVTYNSND